nr:pre B cell leukemia transcription factor 1 [Hymenolepis microstoma]
MQGENLSYDSGISGCIDFSVENQMLSSTDMSSSIDTSMDSSLKSQTLSSVKRDECEFAASALLESSEDMQSSYIHTLNDSIDISGYQDEIERGDDLQFLTPDGPFHLPVNAPNESTSVINLTTNGSGSISSLTRPRITNYSSLNTNQSYSYQPMQFSNVPPPTTHYSTLGQVLTCNSERSVAHPNLINSFLRCNNGSNSSTSTSYASTPITSGSFYESKNTRNSKFQRVTKKVDVKQPKPRGDGSKLLSTRATYVLEGWYEANTEWPYPTKSEKQVMASAGGITIEQVNSWFANRRNRSQNTRPKKNMVKLIQSITLLCEEYQEASNGVISAPEMKSRILALINYHLQRKQ